MIRHGVDADPEVLALLAASPKFLLKRIAPHTAAGAIADGLERRKRAVTAPGRWRPFAALRGLLGPALDARLARDPRVRRALSQLENRQPPELQPSQTSEGKSR
jgi:hypothetical protein